MKKKKNRIITLNYFKDVARNWLNPPNFMVGILPRLNLKQFFYIVDKLINLYRNRDSKGKIIYFPITQLFFFIVFQQISFYVFLSLIWKIQNEIFSTIEQKANEISHWMFCRNQWKPHQRFCLSGSLSLCH